jgi:hypothetical protein
MRHIAIRDFALQDWTDRDLVTLVSCPSNANASNMFTKQVGKILFARHTDHISGMTTFFRTQMTLLASRLSSGASGGWLVFPCICPDFPQPHSLDYHSLG